MIVDAHCHAAPNWYEPLETLEFQMDRCGVGAAVLVQLLGQFDNSYHQAAMRAAPHRFASVVAVDPAEADWPTTLKRLVVEGASGVRLRPDAPEALWREVSALGLAVSCVGPAGPVGSPDFRRRLEGLPGLPVVIEHLGGLARPDVGDLEAAKPAVLALADLPNVSLKIPGLGQLLPRKARLPAEGFALDGSAQDLLGEVVDRFGPERLMWSSDFPPVASREGYANALNWTREALAPLVGQGLDLVFGLNAWSVFGPK